MNTRSIAAALAVVALVAACGNDGDDRTDPDELEDLAEAVDDAPPCTDVFADGRPTDDVVAQYDKQPCTDEAGDPFLALNAFWDCGDGTKVHVVDAYGWGRTGDVWHGPDVPKPPSTSPDGAHAGCP